jgi:hypothetical protein
VKILLDESAPRLLKLRLPQLDISTVQEMGWAGLRNGELLQRAEEHFDVFVTADQNLQFQQTPGRGLFSRYPATKCRHARLVPAVETLLATIQPEPS